MKKTRRRVFIILLIGLFIFPTISIASETEENKIEDNLEDSLIENIINSETKAIEENGENGEGDIEIKIKENYIKEDVDYIDVKIGKEYGSMDKIRLDSRFGFKFYDKNSGEKNLSSLDLTLFVEQAVGMPGHIRVYNGRDQHVLLAKGDAQIILGTGLDGEVISVNNKPYRGYISFFTKDKNLAVINRIDLDQYLYGVVPREIPSSSEIEALKAQAVAARNYAYISLGKHRSNGYDICDTTHCQVYGGQDSEKNSTNNAVDQTRGLVAVYKGRIASTFFHSSSGGHTESSEDVWGSSIGYLMGTPDPYSINAPNSSWSIDIDLKEFKSTLISNGIDVGEVQDIIIKEKTPSGRVVSVDIVGKDKTEEVKGSKLRSMMGNTRVKSTLFNIDIEKEWITVLKETNKNDENDKHNQGSINKNYVSKYGFDKDNISYRYSDSVIMDVIITEEPIVAVTTNKNKYNNKDTAKINESEKAKVEEEKIELVKKIRIYGAGYGHGVGMSQYGAMEMAKQGFSFIDILQHYYRGIDVKNKKDI